MPVAQCDILRAQGVRCDASSEWNGEISDVQSSVCRIQLIAAEREAWDVRYVCVGVCIGHLA